MKMRETSVKPHLGQKARVNTDKKKAVKIQVGLGSLQQAVPITEV